MDLRGQIMNLPDGCGLSEIGTTQGEQLAYKRGHKAARHAAAELAAAYEHAISTGALAMQRPDDFDFAMEFLGDPEAEKVGTYVGALELQIKRLREFLVTIRDTRMGAEDAAQHAANALVTPNV